MTGVSLQFHFGQYVEYLGYEIDTLGRILSISMVGALLIRLHIGRWIDRFGCRPMWLVGSVVVAAAVGSVQFVERLWLLVTLRALSTMATASVMTTVAVFAAQIAPRGRRAESMGTMGLGGFLGMIMGPTLGDWIFSGSTDTIAPYHVFFSASAACSLLAGCVILLLLPPEGGRAGETQPTDSAGTPEPGARRADVTGHKAAGSRSQLAVIVEHWPGVVLLIGVVFSMVFCLQSLFLERLAEERGFKDIKLFFLVYGPTAMTLRVVFRHLPRRFGRSRTLFGGLLLLATGLLFLTGIHSQWQLALPAMLMGAGHAFIFPSMVDLAAERLPFVYRGTGTALILGAGDLGMLMGYVVLGEVIDVHGFDAALKCLAGTVLFGAVAFAVVRRDALLFKRRRVSRSGSRDRMR